MTEPYRYSEDKEALLKRMKRIEGQARGIHRMIEEERYCVDIVQQLTSLSAAADEVSLKILEGHIQGCVSTAIREGHADHHIRELMTVLRKAVKR